MVVRPSPYDRVECLYYSHSRGLLVCVQVGTYGPQVFEDFFLLWDGQQCSLFPEFPDVKPQEVKPFRDMYDPGFPFICAVLFRGEMSLLVVWRRSPVLLVLGPLSQSLVKEWLSDRRQGLSVAAGFPMAVPH